MARRNPRRLDPVERYAREVIAGKLVTGKWVRLACQRHLRDLKEAKKKGWRWFANMAQKGIDFFREMLVLEDGSPFELLDWQQFVVGSLFGWYRVDGYRRFRTAYVETGKGSGKTPLAAGLGLYGLVADGQPAPEIYSAATTRDQAKIVWKDAWRMVMASPELCELILAPANGDVQIGSLTIPKDSAVFRPVSTEHRGLDGKRVHMALIDELHEHPSAVVVDKMRAGTKRQQNALIFEITNSGYDRTSVCWKHHELSEKVLEGSVENDAWFAYVCTLDEGDDWTNETVWPKANPGLGRVLPLTYLREQVKDALTMPSKENIVKRLNFCIWTEQSERWIEMEAWRACAQPLADIDGRRCWIGLDMAARRDLCAAAFLYEPGDDGIWDVRMRFWIPEYTLTVEGAKEIDRAEADRLLLNQWVDEGFITKTPGNVADYDLVEEQLLQELMDVELVEVAYDPWNVTQLITHLKDRLGDERVVEQPQGFAKMSAPSKELERLLVAQGFRHAGNPVLSWMASNVSIKHGPDKQIRPDRVASREKIDGIVALIAAIARATAAPRPTPTWDGHVEMLR